MFRFSVNDEWWITIEEGKDEGNYTILIWWCDNDNVYNQDNAVLHLIIKLRSILAPKISSS